MGAEDCTVQVTYAEPLQNMQSNRQSVHHSTQHWARCPMLYPLLWLSDQAPHPRKMTGGGEREAAMREYNLTCHCHETAPAWPLHPGSPQG